MKVIFLDFDGPLVTNPNSSEFDVYGYAFFDEKSVLQLNRIISETRAKIVVSSTWRTDGIYTLRQLWKRRNMNGEIIDITPILNYSNRGVEIQEWLNKNTVESYVIIDDDNHGILPTQSNYYVNATYYSGITPEVADKAINILRGINHV